MSDFCWIPDCLPTTPAPCTRPEDCTETCECKPDGRYPSPIDCRYFYDCAGGNIRPSSCQSGSIFNPATKVRLQLLSLSLKLLLSNIYTLTYFNVQLCESPDLGGVCWACVPAM